MEKAEKPTESWRERKRKIKKRWHVPFIYVEWKCEQLSALMGRWAFLDILEHIGRLTIIVAIFFYFYESGSRQKAKHYQAWQVINAAQGKSGSGGRIDALEDLNDDGVSLTGVNISNAYVPELTLKNAIMIDANLSDAHLSNADLSWASLWNANLSEVVLVRANLFGAILLDADLSGADLRRANLYGVHLNRADFSGANLSESNLEGINKWQEIKSIENANIYGVENPPDGFIEWAKERGAVSFEDDKEWEKFILEKKKQ